MMYRQGWIDASVYLEVEMKKQSKSILDTYKELNELAEELPET